MRTQARRHAVRHHFEDAAHRVAGAIGVVDHLFHAPLGFGVHAAQQDLVPVRSARPFRPIGAAVPASLRRHAITWLNTVNAEFAQKCFGQGAHRHARRRFAGAGALQNVARIGEIVLDGPRQIGMAGTGTGDRLVLFRLGVGASTGSSRSSFSSLCFRSEWRWANRWFSNAGRRRQYGAIGFDLHAAAAAEALLAAPQLAIKISTESECQRAGPSASPPGTLHAIHRLFQIGAWDMRGTVLW